MSIFMEEKMKKSVILAMLVFLAGGLCLFASGKTQNNEQEQGTAGRPVALQMSIWGNNDRKVQFERLMAPFCAENNCTVEVILVPFDEYMQKISIQLASKTAPDVIWLAEKMVPQFIESGELIDLGPVVKADAAYDFNDFFPSTLDLFVRGNRVYGIPFSFGPRVIFYNKTLFDAKNLKTPTELYKEGNWTLDEFFKAAKALTDPANGIYGLKLPGATEPTAYMNSLYDIVLANGADYFNSSMTAFTLDSPGGIKSMQQFYNALFVDESHIKPGDQTQFETGKIAMARDTFSYAANLRGKVNFQWDIIAAPRGPEKNAKVTSGFANYSVTKGPHQDLAAKLVMFMTSKDIMLELVSTFPSPRRSVLNSSAFLNQPNGLPPPESVKLAFSDQIENPGVQSYPAHENYQKIDVEVNRLFEMMFTRQYTPNQIVKMMKERVDPLLK
jgi:multiple sugar transport system substrate-binding protein